LSEEQLEAIEAEVKKKPPRRTVCRGEPAANGDQYFRGCISKSTARLKPVARGDSSLATEYRALEHGPKCSTGWLRAVWIAAQFKLRARHPFEAIVLNLDFPKISRAKKKSEDE
jgi:hypothetical protein